ncbi:acetate--CoA ligase family protein [Saccharopolyspora sp. HNM0983]|uniref:Acetate--CoA ligase family protein n=1 Tax=Saccharopolyspora montiporae TaxID=2781240 RepID=A0A929BD59_9PSEU|nr:acetate--CoA ligase family protein [Saccharopolyspora sp. HNM0983]MBE9375866.1 acetate--CoA ligase family protein [Saccharopolyspora sp. HNM0983]
MTAVTTDRAQRVGALFNPRSIALVGATDKSGWSATAFQNLREHGFPGPVHLVNPHASTVHGQPAHPSLSAIPEPVDLAYVMVPTAAVLDVLRDGSACGVRSFVVLTAGFGEAGEEGARREREIAEFAAAHGLTVLGPNGNGYINAATRAIPYGLPVPHPLRAGSVGIVLHSGALASAVLNFCQARDLGFGLLAVMGNETDVTVTDVLEHLIDDPDTRVIALFLEQIRRPEEFVRAARRAADAGKPIVALKVGTSEQAVRTAQAHTGALVGDDRVADAALRRCGVIRVHSLEDLIITAGMLAEVGPVRGDRIGVVTPSGGASEILADRAADEGLQLPEFSAATRTALAELLPDFAAANNPLDVTGYVVLDRSLLGRALEVVAEDPGIDAVLLLADLPRAEPPQPEVALEVFRANAERIRRAPVPVAVVSNVCTDVGEFARRLHREAGFPHVAGGMEHGMSALGALVRWSAAVREPPKVPAPRSPVAVPAGASGTWSEYRAAGLLAEHGIPVVPARRAADEDTAVSAAEAIGYPVVLKAVADGLGHKSDIGGVRLDLADAEAVRTAYREVAAVLHEQRRTGEGVLLQPQRTGGVELLVGVLRDPVWGPVLAVGLGGIWVEVLADTELCLLPAGRAEVRAAFDRLRGAGLLHGARGQRPADLDALVDVVLQIGDLADGLGPDLESLEVNPLLVDGSRVEALDALITWRGR